MDCSAGPIRALNPAIVVAGHKKPGAPDSPATIQDTKRYLQDFDRLQKTATSDRELFDQITELYPHWVRASIVKRDCELDSLCIADEIEQSGPLTPA